MILGAHCSTAGGLHKALERAHSIGAGSCQIFVKNNMQWMGRPYRPEEVAGFQETRRRLALQSVFGHTGYLINLGAPSSPNRDRSVESLVQELQLASVLGLPFLVLHPGAHLGTGEAAGLKQVIQGLNEVFRRTSGVSVRIALENTAGQGTCLGARIAHLGEIYRGVDHPGRLGVCLDTAHFFAAGYDIRTPRGWEAALAEVEREVGLDRVLALHLNDSKGGLGSHLDRHAGIGEGRMGREAFRHIVRDKRFEPLPGCLETPKSEDLHEDVENLRILRSLAGGGRGVARKQQQARRAGAATRRASRGRRA